MNDSISGNSSQKGSSTLVPEKKGPGGLYAEHKKIYVRATDGLFARWRWVFVLLTQVVFYGLPWLMWNDRQAVLLHLVERKFYIFGWVFWPQDVFFLTILLIISAYSLFFFTAIAGRLWCGYGCPQTVYTELFLWIEQKIEGDHVKRAKLDASPMSRRKFALKTAKYVIWGALALWTSFTFVAYFSPLKELLTSVSTFSFGPWETFWILFYGVFTFVFAGSMREQVCRFMCPYARFQSVMFDPDTLVVTYDEARGEPRTVRRKGEDAAGRGDCIDCGICVQVCPTGIDIRDGLQYECIGCAACIDACDQIMDKIGAPRGLVRYSTENALKRGWGKSEILHHVLRLRTLIYSGVLLLIGTAFIWGLATRIPLRVDVIRDRASLGQEIPGGLVENVYLLRVMNMTEKPRVFVFDVDGLREVQVSGEHRVAVGAAQTQEVTLRVHVPLGIGRPGANEIFFDVSAEDDPGVKRREKASFFFPL
ncbi:MAG: cytochrome c oxidase accessory protein CcoG [Azoarcus sp.]|jgi:cytochrome c oxidase accessory protein FixG|nr:cytochrome c oxidase accessory protein CcoG [Azoarcus sp.]